MIIGVGIVLVQELLLLVVIIEFFVPWDGAWQIFLYFG